MDMEQELIKKQIVDDCQESLDHFKSNPGSYTNCTTEADIISHYEHIANRVEEASWMGIELQKKLYHSLS